AVVLSTAGVVHAQDEDEALSARFRRSAREVLPAVVTIRGIPGSMPVMPGRPFGPLRGRPIPPPALSPEEAEIGASGVVLDAEKGLILTTDHAVADGAALAVTLPDGRERPVLKVASDPRSDLALLTIDPTGLDLKAATWGDSETLDI